MIDAAPGLAPAFAGTGVGGLTAADRRALEIAAAAAIAYRERVPDRPINPTADYEAMHGRFAEPLPEAGLAPDAVIADLVGRSEPGLMGMTSPRFFGWVIGGSHPAGVAADFLISAWGQNSGLAVPTPATAAIEEVAGQWLLDLLDLPRDCAFGFCTGATTANATALAAARNAVLARAGWDVEAEGLFGAPEVTVAVGEEAHSSVRVALRMIGFGGERVRVVAADGQGRMRPEALAEGVADVAGPLVVVAQAGHINSGACDPMTEIVEIARAKRGWVHVDGAFGIWAHAHPALRPQAEGLDRADSWAADGHKWLQVPYDCGFVFARDVGALRGAMGHSAVYLVNSERLRDPADYVPELSRRARGVPVWAIVKALGREGVLAMIERNCRLARRLADLLTAEPDFTVLNEVCLNQVALALGPKGAAGDALTRAVLARVQAEGVAYPTHGLWHGRQIIRFSICGHATTDDDIEKTVAAILRAHRETLGG